MLNSLSLHNHPTIYIYIYYQRKLQRVSTSTSTIGVPDAASIVLLAQGQPIYNVYNIRSTKCCCPCASNNMLAACTSITLAQYLHKNETKMCSHGQFRVPSMACANLGQQVPIASNFATWLTAVPVTFWCLVQRTTACQVRPPSAYYPCGIGSKLLSATCTGGLVHRSTGAYTACTDCNFDQRSKPYSYCQ